MTTERNSLRGQQVFISGGSTRAPIDAVRYLSNHSTGGMGAQLVKECLQRGAEVTYMHGPHVIDPTEELTASQLKRLHQVPVETLPEVLSAVQELCSRTTYTAILHAMAVLDYLPSEQMPGKIKSDRKELILKLTPAPKVLPLLRTLAPNAFLVAFKLEVDVTRDELCQRAHKLIEKGYANMVVANLMPPGDPKLHVAYLVREDYWRELDLLREYRGKEQIASAVVQEMVTRLG